LVSKCPFEKHHKSVTKSSPYFELFKILQKVNDLSWNTLDGKKHFPTKEQKQRLREVLWSGKLNSKHKLTVTQIKSILGYGRNNRVYFNFTELDGSKTYAVLKAALMKAGIESPERYLFFNLDRHDEKAGLFELWHITYSLPTEKEVVNTLVKRFDFSEKQARIIAQNVGYTTDYGNLSTRAIRKLLPHLQDGLNYSEACDKVNYDHSGYRTKIQLQPKLHLINKNELRNPVVEQILNQVVNMVNLVVQEYGEINEIRVELARELRNSARTRKRISKSNTKNKKNNDRIRKELKEKHGFKLVNGRDVKRFILWEETNKQCLYCTKAISGTDVLTGNADIEHILPKSRSFNNAMSNYILAHKSCNANKGQMTAYDYMASKGEKELDQFVSKVNDFYGDGKGSISRAKFENLLCKGKDIPSDFVERMKKDSQYIVKESVKLLKYICPNVYTTTGQVTDFLRDEWELKHLMQDLNIDKYKAIDQIEEKTIKTGNGQTKTFSAIKDWSKRDDHRHHAVDALICALTDQKIIFKLNNLNKIYQYERGSLTKDEIETDEKFLDGKFSLKEFSDHKGNVIPCAIPNIRQEAKKHLEKIFVSFKKENSKVLTKNTNRPKNSIEQTTWVPRGRLHEDTVMGKIKRIADKKVKLNGSFSLNDLKMTANPKIKKILTQHLLKYDNNPKQAFLAKSLKQNPLLYKNEHLKEITVYEQVYTKRVAINKDKDITNAQIDKIIDTESKRAVKERLQKHDGKIKKAFKNLTKNPILLKNGMIMNTITVCDESKIIEVRNGYAISGKNHHVLIFKDENDKYNEKVVSFWDAVKIGLLNIDISGKPYPIIERKNDAELGQFQFSLQINDLVVFDLVYSKNPQEKNELDFFDEKNRKQISDKLFRVQKISKNKSGQFIIDFRHHLETKVERKDKEGKKINESKLKHITWEKISKNSDLARLTKIRLNHLGKIKKIGE